MRNIKITNIVENPQNRLQKVLSPKDHIEAIIELTFQELSKLGTESGTPPKDGCKSRLIFPSKRDTDKKGVRIVRYSEQELRFLFVEQFNQYCQNNHLNWFYSVETPTKYKYRFSEEKDTPKVDPEKGQSAMFDLTIYNKQFNRIALIEFKAGNPAEEDFTKDFLKLREEGADILTFFIMYVQSYQRNDDPNYDTIASLHRKIEEPTDAKGKFKQGTKLYCYVLKPSLKYKETRIEKLIEDYQNS